MIRVGSWYLLRNEFKNCFYSFFLSFFPLKLKSPLFPPSISKTTLAFCFSARDFFEGGVEGNGVGGLGRRERGGGGLDFLLYRWMPFNACKYIAKF